MKYLTALLILFGCSVFANASCEHEMHKGLEERANELYETVIAEADAVMKGVEIDSRTLTLFKDKNGEMRPIDMVRLQWMLDKYREHAGRDLNLVEAVLKHKMDPSNRDPDLLALLTSWLGVGNH